MPVFKLNFFLIFFWAFVAWFVTNNKRKRDLLFLTIIFVQFTLIASLRDFGVGQDTMQYFLGFQKFAKMTFTKVLMAEWEPGYTLLNWSVAQLGGDYRMFLLITGAFINFSFLRFFYRYSDSVWLSVVIYVSFGYFFASLHILRQYLAIAIVLYSYKYMLERKFGKFLLLILAASLFHTSAIVFIPTYFLCNQRLNPFPMMILFLASLISAFMIGDVILGYLTFNEKYAKFYLNDKSGGAGYSMLMLLSAIMVLALLLKPRHPDKRTVMFYWAFFIALCLQPLATVISLVSRAILYWVVSVTIILPMIISDLRSRKIRLMAYAVVVMGLTVFFLFISNAPEGVEAWGTYRLYINK